MKRHTAALFDVLVLPRRGVDQPDESICRDEFQSGWIFSKALPAQQKCKYVFYHICRSVNYGTELESITGDLNSSGGSPRIPVTHLSLLFEPRMQHVLPYSGMMV